MPEEPKKPKSTPKNVKVKKLPSTPEEMGISDAEKVKAGQKKPKTGLGPHGSIHWHTPRPPQEEDEDET